MPAFQYFALFSQDATCISMFLYLAKMPADSEEHYGFSYFAIELNELLESQKDELPCTDCRFRPDQTLLENGRVQEAESEKRRVEQVKNYTFLYVKQWSSETKLTPLYQVQCQPQ